VAGPGLGPPLADLTTLGVGGPCAQLLEASSDADVVDAVRGCDGAGEPVLVLGGGSNVVVADAGFPGTVVRMGTRGLGVERQGDAAVVAVAAGEPWDDVVAACVAEGLAGVEALSGIPGRAGATPVQNVGAYGQELADCLVDVRVWDRDAAAERVLSAAQCGLGYRTSALRGHDRLVVLGLRLRLQRGATSRPVAYGELAARLGVAAGQGAPLAEVRAAVLALRAGKGMVWDPTDPDTASVGSFFTNPVVSAAAAAGLPGDAPRYPAGDGQVKLSAAWLIERSGTRRGERLGRAAVSSKHTLALTNTGGATTAEVLSLGRLLRDRVAERFGVALAVEPTLVGCSL